MEEFLENLKEALKENPNLEDQSADDETEISE